MGLHERHDAGMATVEKVFAFLREQNWSFTTTEENPLTLRVPYQGDSGEWSLYIRFFPDEEALVFYSVFPVDAPSERRQDMLTLITQINIKLLYGNFQMHLDDGEILFRTSIPLRGHELSPQLIKNAALSNVQTMNLCLRGMMLALYEKCSLEDALLLMEV